ncbi:MAG: signal recognition particle protein [Enterocloster sp.]
MAFESLSDKLQNIFKNLRGKGRLSEADVKAALKEVKMALLEADVSFKVVKQFISSIQERAVGEEVFGSLTPGQTVIKIVTEELVKLMGSETTEIALKPGNEITVIMMAGLQGAGKTTTTAKIAAKLKAKGRKPLLVACDVYRPAAIKQLQINGEKVDVPVFSMGDKISPVDIAKAAVEHASKNNFNVVILDTAGRLHVDENMMEELEQIKEVVNVYQTILVVDAMTGQDAVNVSGTFNDKIGIDGVILTKLDGDTRGGAALSIRSVTGKPILYIGMGEKLSDLEQFYPDRMASRILGMGDIQSLIEKAAAQVDEEQAKELSQKLRKAEFDYNDFLNQMQQIRKMGGMGSILSMMPGVGSQLAGVDMDEGERSMHRVESIILSMTKEERANPGLINPSRKQRIAKGAGVDIGEVNRLVKQFDQMKKMMKQMPGLMGGGKRKGMKGLGGLGGLMGGKMKLPF